jgi:hypothetical protein
MHVSFVIATLRVAVDGTLDAYDQSWSFQLSD